MKKKNSTTKIISALIALFALIGVFTTYAQAFDEKVANNRGSVLDIMFGLPSDSVYVVVVPLVIAFCLLLGGALLAFAGFVLSGKAATGLFLFEAAALIAAGVLFLFDIKFFFAANAATIPDGQDSTGTTSLGAGTITTAVFAFLGAATALIGVLANKKED